MALMVESGFPGWRAVAMAWLSRSTAAPSAAETSEIVRDRSVAVSMARSAMRGCGVGWIVSLFTCRCSLIDVFEAHGLRPLRNGGWAMRPSPLAIRACAHFEQRVKDLWLSATGAVLNGG